MLSFTHLMMQSFLFKCLGCLLMLTFVESCQIIFDSRFWEVRSVLEGMCKVKGVKRIE